MQQPPNEQVRAGEIARDAIDCAKELCQQPIEGKQLDKEIEMFIRDSGGKPALKGYHPSFSVKPYEWTICLSLDQDVVHGIPLKPVYPNDMITVDLVVEYEGWHADTARTFTYSDCQIKQRFIGISDVIFSFVMTCVTPHQDISFVGKAVEMCAKVRNYGIIREYCGHGIGQSIHSSPQIPNYFHPGKELFEVGKSYAVEPVIAINPNYSLSHNDDGFTVSADCLVSHNEDTLFIGADKVINLTG